MRRGLASLIIGLSLIVASLSWASFTLSRTVLDPGRSERLADELLENPNVRQALVVRMADALEAQIPSDVPVPRGVLEAGAATALDDPRVEALIRDGFVQVHQNALNGVDEPVTVDASALGAAGRDVLVELRPELQPVLPATPALEVELPTTGLSWLGSVKNGVDRFTGISALVALCGAGLAFVVAKNRAKVLRRVAFWGYGASAFWLVIAYAIPWLAGNLSPTSAAIASAATDVFFGAMIQPAIMMAIGATTLLLASFLLPAFQRRRGAAKLQPRGPAGALAGPGGHVGGPSGPIPAGVYPGVYPQAPPTAQSQPMPRAQPMPQPRNSPAPAAGVVRAPVSRQPTQTMPGAGPAPQTPSHTAIQVPAPTPSPMAPTVRTNPPAVAGEPTAPARNGSLADIARPTVQPEPSVLFGPEPDQGATTRVDPDQPPSDGPWRPQGSTDSTDQMPIPDWAEDSER